GPVAVVNRITLRGACVGETTIVSPSWTSSITIPGVSNGGRGWLRDLSITGGRVAIEAYGELSIQNVAVLGTTDSSTAGAGIFANSGGIIHARSIAVRDRNYNAVGSFNGSILEIDDFDIG